MNLRPIDVLARMVGKTAEACQKDLDEGKFTSLRRKKGRNAGFLFFFFFLFHC